MKQPRRSPAPVAPTPAPAGDPAAWVELASGPGVAVRRPRRAWTTGAVAAVLAEAAAAAEALGGAVQLGEVAGSIRGAPLPPHKSHRWGRDIDLAYTLEAYPTPPEVEPSAAWVSVMMAILPWVETIGVSRGRAHQLAPGLALGLNDRELSAAASAASGLPLSVWPGHGTHAHVRLRPELALEVA